MPYPRQPIDSSPRKVRSRPFKGSKVESGPGAYEICGIQDYSGQGGDLEPEPDYEFERGAPVQDTRDRETRDTPRPVRYVCCRTKRYQRSVYKIRDEPPKDDKEVCNDDDRQWIDEKDLAEVEKDDDDKDPGGGSDEAESSKRQS